MWYYGKSEGRYLPHYTKARLQLGYPPNIRIYNVKEAAVILRHQPDWIRAQIKAGLLKARPFSGRYWIPAVELTRWMTLNPGAPKRNVGNVYSKRDAERDGYIGNRRDEKARKSRANREKDRKRREKRRKSKETP